MVYVLVEDEHIRMVDANSRKEAVEHFQNGYAFSHAELDTQTMDDFVATHMEYKSPRISKSKELA